MWYMPLPGTYWSFRPIFNKFINSTIITTLPRNIVITIELFRLIEIVFLATAVCTCWILIYYIYTVHVHHNNLRLILITVFIEHYPTLLARACILLIEFDVITNANWLPWILLISSFFRYYVIFGALGTLPCGVVERVLSLVYIEDYEKVKRRHIGIVIICVHRAIAVLFCYSLLFANESNFYICSFLWNGFFVFISIGAAVVFFIAFKKNKNHLSKLERYSNPSAYSLSIRYQLDENLKVFEIFKPIVVMSGLLHSVFGLVLLIPLIYDETTPQAQVGFAVIDFCIAGYGIIATVFVIGAIDVYRRKALALLGCKKVSLQRPSVVVQPDLHGDVYFAQFKNAW